MIGQRMGSGLAHGATITEILEECEGLVQEDIQACFLFATKTLENTTFMPLTAEMRNRLTIE